MENTYTVAILANYQLDSEFLRLMVENNLGGNVIATFTDYETAPKNISHERPSIAIVEEPENGKKINLSALIGLFKRRQKIVVISRYAQMHYVKKVMRLGVKGFITRSSSATDLQEVIKEVLDGKVALCREVRDRYLETEMGDPGSEVQVESLSPKELAVVNYLRSGLTSKEIGHAMDISKKTVEVHRHNILKKMKFKSTASLISYLHEYRMFDI